MSKLIINILEAKNILLAEDIIGIPTETVYGLAADASSLAAIQKIYALKNRPMDRTLALNIHPDWSIDTWCKNIPDYARKLIRKFWPGPLTLIFSLKDPKIVLPLIQGPENSIALRAPNHPLTLALLKQFGWPIVAPSANPSNYFSATSAIQVADFFKTSNLNILDGGPCALGMESTNLKIIDDKTCKILRFGAISAKQIEETIGFSPIIEAPNLIKENPSTNFYYFLNKNELLSAIKKIAPKTYGLIASDEIIQQFQNANLKYVLPSTLEQIQLMLYQYFIKASKANLNFIFIEMPETTNQDNFAIIQQIKKFANSFDKL
jgi:L-threonylcarbamoyladenylate synthase